MGRKDAGLRFEAGTRNSSARFVVSCPVRLVPCTTGAWVLQVGQLVLKFCCGVVPVFLQGPWRPRFCVCRRLPFRVRNAAGWATAKVGGNWHDLAAKVRTQVLPSVPEAFFVGCHKRFPRWGRRCPLLNLNTSRNLPTSMGDLKTWQGASGITLPRWGNRPKKGKAIHVYSDGPLPDTNCGGWGPFPKPVRMCRGCSGNACR